MRAAFKKTVLVVDEGSLASTVQARDLLRIAGVLRIPRVVLVGGSKQLDAVDAGKPFAQLQQAGMKTAVMDEIMRQRDPDLKAAVEASLAGATDKAFEKLGANVAEVKADNIAGAVAARWLKLSPEARERTGVMTPSHELREGINGHVRELREGINGHVRERRVAGVDHARREVLLDRDEGGSEVYRAEAVELRAGDRVRWTRNHKALGLVNSHTADVTGVNDGKVSFRLEDGRVLSNEGDPQLRHLDHAWASTVHAFQGRTVDNVIAAMEANHPHLTTQKSFYVEISRAQDRAELVTDDAKALREQLEAATGERISALEGIGEAEPKMEGKANNAVQGVDRQPAQGPGTGTEMVRTDISLPAKEHESSMRERGHGMDLEL